MAAALSNDEERAACGGRDQAERTLYPDAIDGLLDIEVVALNRGDPGHQRDLRLYQGTDGKELMRCDQSESRAYAGQGAHGIKRLLAMVSDELLHFFFPFRAAGALLPIALRSCPGTGLMPPHR